MSSAEDWAEHLSIAPLRLHLAPQDDPDQRAAIAIPGYRVHSVPLDEVGGKTDLMQVLASHLQLPDYFGHNWDALLDCLSDFGWDPEPGRLIVLERADVFAKAAWPDFVEFIEILIEATLRMHRYARNLHVVVVGDGARSAVKGVAGTPLICDHFDADTDPAAAPRAP